MVNIQNIEEGLKGREEALIFKKEKQVEDLTEKFFNGKIKKDEYLDEKKKIDKWFKIHSRQLKKVKKSLLQSCSQARKILESQVVKLNTEKSHKMLKCLSDKYIRKNNWTQDRGTIFEKKPRKKQKLRCELEEDQDFIEEGKQYIIEKQDEITQQKSDEFTIFNKRQAKQSSEECNQFSMSPKMLRSLKEEDINEYKYEEIQRIIEEDEDGFEENIPPIEAMVHQFSDKFQVPDQVQIEDHQISLINNLVNECRHKFKYLCNEDKQDIFEFLFLDLVLEMFTEGIQGQSRILKSAEVYIHKAKRLRKIPKGIKTNISASKEYLTILSRYVVGMNNGLKNMSHPMGPSAIEMLRYMRDQIIQAEDQQAVSSTLVLPIDIFEKVSKLPELQLRLQKYYDDQQKQLNRLSFLRTALNINNKSLFDCLNQNLDHQRPYGVWGKPFPWKKALSVERKWNVKEEQKKMKKCLDKTIESCSYLCGILVDKQESLFGSHRVSEEYVMQIRQDRLSKMLANELIQNEERWIFYDDEQTQILMEVSSFITKKLIKQIILEMISIKMKI